MPSECSCSVTMSVVLCHNTTVLSQCVVVQAQHAPLNALDKGAVSTQLCSKRLYGAQNRD